MSWSSRRNGIPRIGRTQPAPPLKDLSDREYADMVDDEQERAYEALHAPHDDARGFHLSPDGGEGHARSMCRCDGRCFDEDRGGMSAPQRAESEHREEGR